MKISVAFFSNTYPTIEGGFQISIAQMDGVIAIAIAEVNEKRGFSLNPVIATHSKPESLITK
jgi:hypothetical protein